MSHGLSATFVKRFSPNAVVQVENLVTETSAGVTVLFGPSGAGKTTTIRCIAGLEQPTEGSISFNGERWFDSHANLSLRPQKRRLGIVPQDFGLFPHLSVAANVGYGLSSLNAAERKARIGELIDWLALRGLEKRLPSELSGGQRQRVALARAVARKPSLLLLDEPLAALDLPTRQRVRSELRQWLKQAAIPAILITHDRYEALALGDKLVLMNDGRIVQQGAVDEVFSRPADSSAAAIVGMENVQMGQVLEQTGDLVTIGVGAARLIAIRNGLGKEVRNVYVCIRAEDVILLKGEVPQSSPRNSLPATVRQISANGPMMQIGLDCGFSLVAALTRQACQEMSLAEGTKVLAMIKAPNVHLVER
jgi:molybdate transport system ATP-binding protein